MYSPKAMVLNGKQLCTRPVTGRHLTTSGDTSGCHRWGDPTGIKWVKARDVLRHPTMHRTGSTVKNHRAQNDDSANPALMLHIQIFAGFCHAISWVCKSILLTVIFPEPHTLPDRWCALESRVFYFFGSFFFFKEKSHREVCIHANGFYMFTTVSIHTFLSCNLFLHCFFASASTWECTTWCPC